MNEMDNINEMNDIKQEFIHFTTSHECEDFVQYLRFHNIDITHKCCDNKGCGLINSKSIYVKNIIKNYSNKKVICDIYDICYICYELKNLITNCNICKHPFCVDCLNRIKNSKCAYCRS